MSCILFLDRYLKLESDVLAMFVNGSYLKYALDENGKLVHVDNVPNGYKCNCKCPACHEPLSARQGKKRAHVFAHQPGSNCKYGYQTTMHILAKEIIEEGCNIPLPQPLFFINNDFNPSSTPNVKTYTDKEFEITKEEYNWLLKKEVSKNPDSIDTAKEEVTVELEKKVDEFIPDVILSIDYPQYRKYQLIIEIYVTHKVDDVKREKIISSGIPAIEFDLHTTYNEQVLEKEDLKKLLEKGGNCKWIYNRKVEKYLGILEKSRKERELCLLQNYGIKEIAYPIYRRQNYYYAGWNNIRCDSYDGELKGEQFIIFDPPCGGEETTRRKMIANIEICKKCIFFDRIEPEKIETNEDNNDTKNILWCKRRPKVIISQQELGIYSRDTY